MTLVRAPVETDDVNIFDKHDVSRDLRDASRSEADDDHSGTPGDRTEAGVKGVTANWIVNYINTTTGGDGLHSLAYVFSGIVNRMVCAVFFCNLQLFRI